jgi:Uma2 family endonuclease
MKTATRDDIWLERRHPIKRGEPAWDIALFYPAQGDWTLEDYLDLDTNQPVEFVDGCLEFLPMPSLFHQRIAHYLFRVLEAWVIAQALGGDVLLSPLRVRTVKERIRLPDIVYIRPQRSRNIHRPPRGADLVIEVVSPGKESRKRDLQEKRREYAKAKIAEYWIVDPQMRKITVLVLNGDKYRVHGAFAPGGEASSVSLPGFSVGVASVFAAGEKPSTDR